VYGLLIALPAAEWAELTAVSSQAYNSRGALGISVAGKTWALPTVMAPFTHGQFEIVVSSRNEFRRLQRILTSPD